jgi:hypothetical protein
MNTTYPSSGMSHQLRDDTTYPSSGMSYQLRDEYYISKRY